MHSESKLLRHKKIPKGSQNPYIKEEQTTQWPKEKGQQYTQRFTKHRHRTNDQVKRTSLKTGNELRSSGMLNSSCSTSGIRRFTVVTNRVIRSAWRYQRGNQNPYIEEKQTTQWPNEKELKYKQRSIKHAHKTKDRVKRTPL
jgi:hypothetical protein